MLADIEARTAQLPTKLLADANHAKHACITLATRRGVEVLIAVPKREQNACTHGVVPEIAAWRDRMKTEEAKRAYRSRAGLCELVNAHFKSHHGAAHVLVRGLEKVTCVAASRSSPHSPTTSSLTPPRSSADANTSSNDASVAISPPRRAGLLQPLVPRDLSRGNWDSCPRAQHRPLIAGHIFSREHRQ
jgi:hypothetical protein